MDDLKWKHPIHGWWLGGSISNWRFPNHGGYPQSWPPGVPPILGHLQFPLGTPPEFPDLRLTHRSASGRQISSFWVRVFLAASWMSLRGFHKWGTPKCMANKMGELDTCCFFFGNLYREKGKSVKTCRNNYDGFNMIRLSSASRDGMNSSQNVEIMG